ncbi:MAG: glycosyltransferase family 4 protein [Chloroflexi bacterium]|nr:MAG: glycosyltransferase family 4 protein [Chloroflexota bacterium]
MRIAQVAPLYEAVPPTGYGGTERVVSYLTEELVRQGHEVTLFATADSRTSGHLVPMARMGLRLDPNCTDPIAVHLAMLEEVSRQIETFDVMHFHTSYLHFPLVRRQSMAHLTTQHGRLDFPEFVALHREFADLPMVSISESQRLPLAGIDWRGTVYHGLPSDLYHQGPGNGGYLAFMGRFSPEKGFHDAVEMARRIGMPLRVAAKIEPINQDYFDEVVRPLLLDPLVDWVGEVSDAEKQDFLGNAAALLFPIAWPEPFGMVMIEAMACGTPTIAYRAGSVPEVIEDGRSGFVVRGVDEAVAALDRLGTFDRQACRAAFDERFTVERMAADYVRIYADLIGEQQPAAALSAGVPATTALM